MTFNSKAFIKAALAEDIGQGDYTSLACIDAEAQGTAKMLAKDTGIIAGIELAAMIYKQVDPEISFEPHAFDGKPVRYGNIIFMVSGKQRSLLMAERLVLNFMQRMSGISTMANLMVKAVEDYDVTILDTRKTTPTLRWYEKWAARIGGAQNHRMGLYDMVMIKDNHIDYAGGIDIAIKKVHEYLKNNKLQLKIEIEARSISDVKRIIRIGSVDRIMLDNMNPDQIKSCIKLINGKFETEASGNITIENVKDYADSGVNYISSGFITHSAGILDLSIKAVKY